MIEADFLVVVTIVSTDANGGMTDERANEIKEAIEDKLADAGSPLGKLPGTFSVVVAVS